jgi:hypothetical protein
MRVDHKEFFIVLDEQDLLQLMEVVDRAFKKAETLTELLDKSGPSETWYLAMPATVSESCYKKSPGWALEYAKDTADDVDLKAIWKHRRSTQSKREQCTDWAYSLRSRYEVDKRVARVFRWCHRPHVIQGWAGSRGSQKFSVISSARTEQLRSEFTALAEQWRRETQHLSQISKKVTNERYLRIVGMGPPVVPLLLEALRDRPAYWFVALKSTANVDPVPAGASPSQAREAWLQWGATKGLIR